MWKAPSRPRDEISQSYSDGILTVYSVTDVAAPGYMPDEALTEKITLRYAEQRLGIQRYYAAMQNQISIERVVRVPHTGKITTQDIVKTEDGTEYRIDLIQLVTNVYPRADDLTLTRVTRTAEVQYDVV